MSFCDLYTDITCIEGMGSDYCLLMNLLNGAHRYVLQLMLEP